MIIQMPAADKYVYGDSKKTKILYNLVTLIRASQAWQKEITELKKQVETLTLIAASPCVSNKISTTTGKPEYCKFHYPDPNS